MREKLLRNFSGKLVAAFIALALFVTGVCYIGAEGSVALAAETESALKVADSENYYSNEESQENIMLKNLAELNSIHTNRRIHIQN